MSERKAGERLQSFIQKDDGKWEQSPELKKVLGIMQDNTDVPLKVEMAPSPMMMHGQPAWGSSGGVLFTQGANAGRALVDPLAHPTVAAHEAAHQGFMSDLGKSAVSGTAKNKSQEFITDVENYPDSMFESGAALRAAYETQDKYRLIEEANAQGVAQAAMDKAGIPVDTSGWSDMYAYPAAHKPNGRMAQVQVDLDTLGGGETSEYNRIQRSHMPAVKRQFDLGYGRIK